MLDIIHTLFNEISEIFFNPQKRVFIGYLISAWLLAIIWLIFFKQQHFKTALSEVFSKKIWLSTSARTDYLLLFFNKIIMSLISPALLGQIAVATVLFEWLHRVLNPDAGTDWPVWLIMSLFTLVLFILDDASRYLVHRLLHSSTFLWRFHRVHHSATTLTPFTIFRTHPVEGVLFTLRSAIVQGICIGLFVFIFGSNVSLVSIFGVNILLFALNILGANLRHSHIAISYPATVEKWLISPAQHQLHHSTDPKHYDTNFGVFLSVWDRVGKTFHYSEAGVKLDFGVKIRGEKQQQSLLQLYLSPFTEPFRKRT